MSKHTPGPWVVGQPNKGPVAGTVPVHTADYMESYRSGQLVCSVYGTAAFSDANARLIAASPDMLTALQSVLPLLEASYLDHEGTDNGEVVFAGLEAARAAIAKATGGNE